MKCTYCSTEIRKGTGTMYVHRTGSVEYFCSNRCFKSRTVMRRKLSKKVLKQKAARK